MSSSLLRLSPQNGLFPSGSLTKIRYAFLCSPNMPHVLPISFTVTVPIDLRLSFPPTSTQISSSAFFSLTQSACVSEHIELKSYNVMVVPFLYTQMELGLSVTLQLQHYNYSVDFAHSIHLFGLLFFCCIIYRVSQEECARLQENVSNVKVHRYNPKHLYPKLNGYGDNCQRSLKVWQLLHTYWLPNSY